MTTTDPVAAAATTALAEATPSQTPARQQRIQTLVASLAEADSNAILAFGTAAQGRVAAVADSMLEGVRNKDAGAAGGALSEMVATLRGFDPADAAEERSLFDRVLGRVKPVAKVLQRYEEVRGQIETAVDKLESHKTRLMTDVATLDRLYGETLGWFHDLADYIAAGEQALATLDGETIPKLDADATANGDVLTAQKLRDLRTRRDELDRRVHDLKLTRQVAMQALPSIRVVQENDKSLVAKITSTVLNTVPLWKNQLSLAVAIARSREAGGDLKAASDLSNQLLTANADALRQSNAEIRAQVERGVFDIEAVKTANAQLIATIEDSLRIADDGRKRRVEAERTLLGLEGELKETLRAAQARTRSPAPR